MNYLGTFNFAGLNKPVEISMKQLRAIADKYLYAIIKAREIYKKIENIKGKGNFITEVSMDEVPLPQTPVELLFILKMLGDAGIPAQTIAPKFSGRFNKGIDYEGDPKCFAEEFESDLIIIDFAIKEFGLPEDLKMSVHSGSDKFSIYPYIGSIIRKHNKGIHLKTAGTTWLKKLQDWLFQETKLLNLQKRYTTDLLKKLKNCALLTPMLLILRVLNYQPQ
jgi:hypothetical protein